MDRPSPYQILDTALELSVAGSFSRLGVRARRAAGGWTDPPRMDGKKVLITGASSGIGAAAAEAMGRLGASLWLVGRDRARLEQVSAATSGHPVVADIVEGAQLERLVSSVKEQAGRLDGLVHNAGALFPRYRRSPDGLELTVATHVVAPFRLTEMLRPLLADPSVIVTVSSGGMYTEALDLGGLEMGPDGYRGAVAYARAKRAQVVLAHEWARRLGPSGVASHAMHPGWVRTPGVAAGLPRFSRLGPLLRTPAEGADTLVWLVSSTLSDPAFPREGFWLDRHPRGEHYLPSTRRGADGEELWRWCEAAAARSGAAQ